jgi:hypothetical protein
MHAIVEVRRDTGRRNCWLAVSVGVRGEGPAVVVARAPGNFTEHHGFLLGTMLARIDALDADIAVLDVKIEEIINPFRLGGGET